MRWFALAVVCLTAAPGWANDAGVLRGPWGSVFDSAHDVVFVSNVNGPSLARDGNGFVTEFASDGGLLTAKWAGGDEKSTLHAPKGLAVIDDRLYVADLDTVRVFNRTTGAAVSAIKVLGASSLEGLATFGSRLYVVDSGWRLAADGTHEATGTDGLYAIETQGTKPALKTLVKSRRLRNPRSLAVTESTLYVAASTAPLLFSFDLAGRATGEPIELPHVVQGGLVVKERQCWFASSQGVLRGRVAGDEWQLVSPTVSGPGALSLDEVGHQLWVPVGAKNHIVTVPWAR